MSILKGCILNLNFRRFWELGLLFALTQKLNKGWQAHETTSDTHVNSQDKLTGDKITSLLEMFKGRLLVDKPGSIIFAGHSFGAATVTQFLKSVWYWQTLSSSPKFTALYTPVPPLLKHFHPDDKSPETPPMTIILDLWTLPLLGNQTKQLWRLPLPGPAMGILSQEFFKWKDNLRGNRHVLSLTGGGSGGPFGSSEDDDLTEIPKLKRRDRTSSMDLTAEIPGGLVGAEESKSAAYEKSSGMTEDCIVSSTTNTTKSPSPPNTTQLPSPQPRKLFYASFSRHLSQSDFGVLFKYLFKGEDAERTLTYNTRAIVEFMREQGYDVYGPKDADIFTDGKLEGWEVVGLPVDYDDEKERMEKVDILKLKEEDESKAASKM